MPSETQIMIVGVSIEALTYFGRMEKVFVQREVAPGKERKVCVGGGGRGRNICPALPPSEKRWEGCWACGIKIYMDLLATQNFFIVIINILGCKSNIWHYCA